MDYNLQSTMVNHVHQIEKGRAGTASKVLQLKRLLAYAERYFLSAVIYECNSIINNLTLYSVEDTIKHR